MVNSYWRAGRVAMDPQEWGKVTLAVPHSGTSCLQRCEVSTDLGFGREATSPRGTGLSTSDFPAAGASSTISRMTEAELVSQSIGHLLGTLGFDPQLAGVSQEIGVGRSIADIAVLKRPSANCRRPLAPVSAAEAVLLSLLRVSGPTRIDILERRAHLPPGGLREGSMSKLEEWGLMRKGPGGRVAASNPWVGHPTLVMIEAKLIRWREALEQARVHLAYADQAFVLLPSATASVAKKHRDQFRNAGVGLLCHTGRGVQRVIHSPRSHKHDWRREFILSRLY